MHLVARKSRMSERKNIIAARRLIKSVAKSEKVGRKIRNTDRCCNLDVVKKRFTPAKFVFRKGCLNFTCVMFLKCVRCI